MMDPQNNISFEVILKEALDKGRYVKVAFFNSYHEFHSVCAVMKHTDSGIALTTGHLIQIDKIVSIDEVSAPNYSHIIDFTCDC